MTGREQTPGSEESADVEALARRHVTRFNQAVRDGDWASFAAGFTNDAVMSFTNVPAGPFAGRAAIERAYYAQPPDDTMSIRTIEGIDPHGAVVVFTWDANGPGTMTIHWVDGAVRELVITFG